MTLRLCRAGHADASARPCSSLVFSLRTVATAVPAAFHPSLSSAFAARAYDKIGEAGGRRRRTEGRHTGASTRPRHFRCCSLRVIVAAAEVFRLPLLSPLAQASRDRRRDIRCANAYTCTGARARRATYNGCPALALPAPCFLLVATVCARFACDCCPAAQCYARAWHNRGSVAACYVRIEGLFIRNDNSANGILVNKISDCFFF
jgi:hypothetical protein